MRIQLFIRILLVSAFALAACVTPRDPDLDRWALEQDKIKNEIKDEQHAIRKQIYNTRASSPFFWTVTKDGKTSWLLGTMHSGWSAESLPIPIHRLFNTASRLVLEGDVEQFSKDLQADRKLQEAKATSGNATTPLDQLISPAAWQVLTWDLYLIPPETLRQFKPEVAKLVYIYLRAAILTEEDPDCMDCDLEREAKAQQKQLVYLEGYADLAPLRTPKVNPRDAAKDLEHFLTNSPINLIKKNETYLNKLRLAYRQGDLKVVERLMSEDHEFYTALIAERNAKWLPKLDAVLAEGSTFVAVGVGHMTGPSSLIKMLEKKGYVIKRGIP